MIKKLFGKVRISVGMKIRPAYLGPSVSAQGLFILSRTPITPPCEATSNLSPALASQLDKKQQNIFAQLIYPDLLPLLISKTQIDLYLRHQSDLSVPPTHIEATPLPPLPKCWKTTSN